MSSQNPYETLGVAEDASFEEIQDARSRLSQQHQEDVKLVESIESAYDAIIMDRLKMRQEGKIKVPERIRFPERSPEVTKKPLAVSTSTPPAWLQQFIDAPSRTDVLLPTGIFLGLAVLTFFAQGDEGSQSLVSLVLAFGFGAAIYLINRKENRFGRAFLMALAGLLVGIGLGFLLAGLVNTPVGNGGLAAEQVAALVTLFFFWLTSCFLR
ncbi:MAG: molecular chaperone DnaJ [Spirulinaceae cyanobacterium SM2_1_0]|nr:molecular chaperone DnaJ [Spirulinaceae cyanobacterium SM2_1_0]